MGSLSGRSLLYLLLALCAAGAVVGAWTAVWIDRTVTENRATQQVHAAATAYAIHTGRNLDELRFGLDWLERQVDMQATDFGLGPETLKVGRLIARRLPGLSALVFVGVEGTVRFSTAEHATLGSDVRNRAYYNAASRGSVGDFIGTLIAAKDSGRLVYTLSRRLERNGGFAGIVVASADADRWNEIVTSLVPFPGSRVRLLRPDGSLVLDKEVGSGRALRTFPPGEGEEMPLPGSAFTARLPVSSHPLVTEVSVPRDAAMRAWRTRRTWFALVGAFGLVSLAVFWFLGHRAFRSEAAAIEMAARRTQELEARTAELDQAVKTKELLMAELEHRVKNSLFLAESLLALQSSHARSTELRETLHSARARIRAIARVHARLQSDTNPAMVAIDRYLRELCTDLEATVDLRCNIKAEPVVLRTETAIPIGLIVTELLINAAKHGAGSGTAQADITARAGSREIALVVRDYGAGMPPGFDIAKSTSLGMRIVSKLVSQLRGRIRIEDAGPGARFLIDVPLAANGNNASPLSSDSMGRSSGRSVAHGMCSRDGGPDSTGA